MRGLLFSLNKKSKRSYSFAFAEFSQGAGCEHLVVLNRPLSLTIGRTGDGSIPPIFATPSLSKFGGIEPSLFPVSLFPHYRTERRRFNLTKFSHPPPCQHLVVLNRPFPHFCLVDRLILENKAVAK